MSRLKNIVIILLIVSIYMINPKDVFAKYELERQDIYDYKEFFDDLYPSEDGSSSCNTTSNVYAECSGVTVTGYSTYPLEDYVAGVLNAEFSVLLDNEELGKTAANIVRSYTLANTDNCTKPITSSSYEQNLATQSGDIDMETYKKYAQDTEGMVLTYNGNIVLAPYFALGQGECSSTFVKDGVTMCQIDLETWFGSGNFHTSVVPYDALPAGSYGAHYKGMPQWAASYQANKEGYTMEQLIEEYYGKDVSISKLSSSTDSSNSLSYTCDDTDGGLSSASAEGFKKRTSQPESGNKHFFSSENIAYPGANVGQCTWYAYGRANEVLETASSNLRMWDTYPNAGDWYDHNKSYGSKGFKSSTDINSPKLGAIIVWQDVYGTSSRYPGAGHVAVVEAVNSDNTIDLSEANIGGLISSSNPYGWQYVSHISLSEVKNRWGYSFKGYIYILE